MEENTHQNTGQGFGIAGLIVGILAFIFALIPCTSILAIMLGVLALVFSFLGYNQAKKSNASKGLIIAALVVSLVASLAGISRYFIFQGIKNKVGIEIEKNEWAKDFDDAIDQLNEDGTFEDMEDALDELESGDSLNAAIEKELKDQSENED